MTPYQKRNTRSRSCCIRLPIPLHDRMMKVVRETGVSQSPIFQRLIAAYVDGKIDGKVVDLPDVTP